MAEAFAFARYYVALLFGTLVAAGFAGMPATRKNYLVLTGFTVGIFGVQVLCLFAWGMDYTWKMYPLLCHVPIVLFTVLYLKRPWLVGVVSMFAAFLCCQPPRWVGSLAGELLGSVSMNHLGYIVTAAVTYVVLKKHVVQSVRHLLDRSAKSCLVFGAVPAFYYCMDFATTVYTDFLYRGTRTAVQFMPFLISACYFVFVLFYYAELQKQALVERERDMLHSQFRQAQAEFASMKQMQQTAAAYRHDMRHYLSLLQQLAAEGRLDEIREYLQSVQSDIDAITPRRYCDNETVNLILSAYAGRAQLESISLDIDARLPDALPFSDTELCSLLSNALENAVKA